MGWNALLFIYLQNQVLNINFRTHVTRTDDKLLSVIARLTNAIMERR